jgi:carbamoyltransferase
MAVFNRGPSGRRKMRTGPRHPRLGAASFRLALPLLERFYAQRRIFRAKSDFAEERLDVVRAKLDRGETVYLAGVAAAGTHNSGIALVEVTRAHGPRLIANNEEERFSGNKHTTEYPRLAVDDLLKTMARIGIGPDDIDAWIATWDYPALGATLLRTFVEELPGSLAMMRPGATPAFNLRHLDQGTRAARHLAAQLGGKNPVSLIAIPHHDNHAWYSFAVSPFARDKEPAIVAVLDGTGDLGSISLYAAGDGKMRQIHCNNSVFDSLGAFYSVISSTQGGWTWLSSEGRYMGAAAYGDGDRRTNRFYAPLRDVFSFAPEGRVYLNRSLANWHRDPFHKPYTRELTRILGEPIAPEKMWNPDAVLRVEDIHHAADTQERLDKAAATQMVFEDALFHIIDHAIRQTGSDRLVLTGGVALNAVANMRLLEHFDAAYYQEALGKSTRLHLWVPPTPADSGVTMGAAYMFAYLAGAGVGAPVDHAFYCGTPPAEAEIHAALQGTDDIGWMVLGNASDPATRDGIADLMAYAVAQDGVIALYQGSAETGPRALGHRSILANPCNPRTREVLNEKVKYREAIRPLAPLMTLDAAQCFFDLSDGAADADYNAYNYMVLTAPAKPGARERIPAVIHADGTGRLQIVRENSDPLTYAYLKALGRRIGVEVSVNTSFNVAGPIAQTPRQAVETLRRSKGMDAVFLFSEQGPVFAAWHRKGGDSGERFQTWLAKWRSEMGAAVA